MPSNVSKGKQKQQQKFVEEDVDDDAFITITKKKKPTKEEKKEEAEKKEERKKPFFSKAVFGEMKEARKKQREEERKKENESGEKKTRKPRNENNEGQEVNAEGEERQPREPRKPREPREPREPAPIRNTAFEAGNLDDMLSALTNFYGTTKQEYGFKKLDKKILLRILRLLPLKDLATLSKVDHFFHSNIIKTQSLWSSLLLRDFGIQEKAGNKNNSKNPRQLYKQKYTDNKKAAAKVTAAPSNVEQHEQQ